MDAEPFGHFGPVPGTILIERAQPRGQLVTSRQNTPGVPGEEFGECLDGYVTDHVAGNLGLLGLLVPPNDVPVVMINLLRYKEWTEELGEGMTGAEAYALYGESVLPLVQGYGSRLIWAGRALAPDGQSGNGSFHTIALMEYPSDLVFLQVVSDPLMAEITGYRAAGLEGQWLVPGTTYD